MAFVHRLLREIEEWKREGLIDSELQETLQKRYENQLAAPWYRRSGFIIKSLALTLVFLAILLLISANWETLPRIGKMILVALPLLAAHGLSIFWREDKTKAELSQFFASLMLGANIFLQGQIFHLGTYYPAGFLWWTIGAIPAALLFRGGSHNYLFSGVALVYTYLQGYHEQSGIIPFAFFIISAFLLTRRGLFGIFFLTIYAYIISYFTWQAFDLAWNPLSYFTIATLLAMALIEFAQPEQREKFSTALYAIFLIPFYILTFDDGWDEGELSVQWTAIAISAVLAISVSGRRLVSREKILPAILTLPLTALYLFAAQWSSEGHTDEVVWATNLLFVLFAGTQLYYGLQTKQRFSFFLGVSLALFWALGRYIALSGNYYVTALLFLGVAGALYGAHLFWQKRYGGEV